MHMLRTSPLKIGSRLLTAAVIAVVGAAVVACGQDADTTDAAGQDNAADDGADEVDGLADADDSETTDASDFPNRPIDIVIPWGTGGGSDLFTRNLAQAAEEYSEVPLVPQNLPGSTGEVGLAEFMSMPSDGHAALNITAEYVLLNAADQTRTRYDELYFVTRPQFTPSLFYVPTDHPFLETMDDIVAYSMENPGELRVATTGPGGADDIAVRFLATEGIELSQVAYPEPAERYTAPLQGDADFLYEQPGTMVSFVEAGQYVPVVMFSTEVIDGFEDIPLISDFGIDIDLPQWRGWAIHADAPDDAKEWWLDVARQAGESDHWQEFSAENFTDFAEPLLGDDLNDWVEEQVAVWERILEAIE